MEKGCGLHSRHAACTHAATGQTEVLAMVPPNKGLSAKAVIQEAANVLLNPVSALPESLTPLDKRQWLMVLCQEV